MTAIRSGQQFVESDDGSFFVVVVLFKSITNKKPIVWWTYDYDDDNTIIYNIERDREREGGYIRFSHVSW
jgi:hypothetical protein